MSKSMEKRIAAQSEGLSQAETIIWHKFPNKKPSSVGVMYIGIRYLVQTKTWGLVEISEWHGDGRSDWHNVIAWAEMPKGWKE